MTRRWQPELDMLAPETERGHSSLLLKWEPGEDWAPVGRWVIWETMRPEQAPNMGIREDLNGPHPRTFGFYDSIKRKFIRTRHSTVTRAQWEYHRETGLYGRTVWVVQGRKGGHKRFWSDVEQNVAMMTYQQEWQALGIGADALQPPAVGELCYAEPDYRTIKALRALDMVERYGDLLHMLAMKNERDGLNMKLGLRQKAVAREMARQLWTWMDDQIDETLDNITRAQAQEGWDYADPNAAVPDYDKGYEEFIENTADAVTTV